MLFLILSYLDFNDSAAFHMNYSMILGKILKLDTVDLPRVVFCTLLVGAGFMLVNIVGIRNILRPLAVMSTQAYQPGSAVVAYVTVATEEKGKALAHDLVEAKLAACVNILPKVTSVYEWKGKVNEDSEAMLIIKSTADLTEALTKFIIGHHEYNVPEVITLPIQAGNPQYLNWLSKQVQQK